MRYEYKLISGPPAAAEKQVNELAADEWELVCVTSSQGPVGGFLFVTSAVQVVVTLRRPTAVPGKQAEPGGPADGGGR